jgi:hypothetical protein
VYGVAWPLAGMSAFTAASAFGAPADVDHLMLDNLTIPNGADITHIGLYENQANKIYDFFFSYADFGTVKFLVGGAEDIAGIDRVNDFVLFETSDGNIYRLGIDTLF